MYRLKSLPRFLAWVPLALVFAVCALSKPAAAKWHPWDCNECVQAAWIANTANNTVLSAAEILALQYVILGFGTSALDMPTNASLPRMIGTMDNPAGVGPDVPILTRPAQYSSLVGYLDNVFLPTMLEVNKSAQGNAQKFTAAQGQQQVRVTEANNQIQHTQTVGQMQTTNAMNVLGRADVLCPEPSMGQSDLAAQIMAIQGRDKLEGNAALEVNGSKQTPNFSRGPVYYDRTKYDARRSTTCIADGNNGVNSGVCSGNTALAGADMKPTALTGAWTLSDSASVPSSIPMAKAYIDNVFPNRALRTTPKDAFNENSNEMAQVENSKAEYAALLATFQQPFLEEQAERVALTKDPVTGQPTGGTIAALPALIAAVDRAGYTGEAKAKIVGADGNVSKAALEYIRYKVYEHDPQFIISDVGGMGSLNTGNILSILLTQKIKQVTLKYDIREQMKTTGRLLGAIGGTLAKSDYDELQARITRLSNTPGNQ